MSRFMVVPNDRGIRFMVRMVSTGEGYGRFQDGQFALTNDRDETLVEFYDTRWDMEPFSAQFVSRYNLSTLLESDGRGTGLLLDGGVDNWYLDAHPMALVRQWLSMGGKQSHSTAGTVPDHPAIPWDVVAIVGDTVQRKTLFLDESEIITGVDEAIAKDLIADEQDVPASRITILSGATLREVQEAIERAPLMN